MREQWFCGYLPVLILILMEVILMSHDGEGASAARRWPKGSTGNPMKVDRLGARHQWRKQNNTNKAITARGKRARRIKQRRTDHNESNAYSPESPVKLSNPETIRRRTLVDYLLLNSDEQSSESQSVDDPPMNTYRPKINEITPKAVSDMDIATLLMPQEDINALKPISAKRTFNLLVDLFYLTDFTIGVTCGILTEVLENIKKPYTVIAKDLVQLVFNIFGMIIPFNSTDSSEPNDLSNNLFITILNYLNLELFDLENLLLFLVEYFYPPGPETDPSVPKNPLTWILNFLNVFKLNTGSPDDKPNNPLLWVLNYFNPFEPVTESPDTTTPSTTVDDSGNLLLWFIHYLNPFSPITKPPDTTPSTPIDEQKNPLIFILEFFNLFNPVPESPGMTSRPVDIDKDLLVLILQLLYSFELSMNPPITTPSTLVETPEYPLVLITNHSEPPSPNAVPPLTLPSSPLSYPKNPIILLLNYLNSFKPTTVSPLEPYEKPPKLLDLIINYFDLCETGTDPNTPALLVQEILNTVQVVMNFFDLSDVIVETVHMLDEIEPEIDILHPFRPYIDPIEEYILELDPWDIFEESLVRAGTTNARLKPLQPNHRDTDSFGSNTDVLKPVKDQPHGGTVNLRPQPIDSTMQKSFKVSDLPASNSRPDFYSPAQNQLRRPAQRKNDCPTIKDAYYQGKNAMRAYQFHIEPRNWTDAVMECIEIEGHLVLPEDDWQYEEIIDYAQRFIISGAIQFHAGFYRTSAEGNWVTISGGPLLFEKWINGNDDYMDRLCGAITVSGDDDLDGFIGEYCTEELPFMCEIILPEECA